jgi:hypothetical protein
MYTRKSKGTKNVTCGTPDVTGFPTSRRPRQLNQMGITVADAVQPRQM